VCSTPCYHAREGRMKLPDLFLSLEEYREFSRTMSGGKNEAGWHCSTHFLAPKEGHGILCDIMVRRLDGFDPLKGHLLIIENGLNEIPIPANSDFPGKHGRKKQSKAKNLIDRCILFQAGSRIACRRISGKSIHTYLRSPNQVNSYRISKKFPYRGCKQEYTFLRW